MCGIAGFIDFNRKTSQQVLTTMTDTLEHRGPDDKGYKLWETPQANIGFGQRRLSIIDLSPLGHQPMYSKDGRWAIVFNGEIYNYNEIRDELIALKYNFISHSDTEVIIYAFDCWGAEAVHKFIGMFAFVLYDTQKHLIHIFRDRAGVKPLYYYWKDNVFLFASELKAFHKHPDFRKEIDFDALSLYFTYGYIPAPYAVFRHTHKLTPGHSLTLNLETRTYTTNKYWDAYDAYAKPPLDISHAEAMQETEKIIKSSCEYRMVADVPVGIFLSGGYDSTMVTTMLQKERTQKIKTFTIGYENKTFDETKEARQVANHLGTDHTEYECSSEEAMDILRTLPFFFDEPLGDTSIIPTTLVSRLARKSVTVALSADGGDEIFAGYDRYAYIAKQQNMLRYFPTTLTTLAANALSMTSPKHIPILNKAYNINSRYDKVINLLSNRSVTNAYRLFVSYFQEKDTRAFMQHNFNFPATIADVAPPNGHKGDIIQSLIAIDYKTYMVDQILAKVDRATMSVSLEGREPLLDHRILEFAAQLPSHFKYRDGTKKYLLREIVHQYVPQDLLVKRKMGFGAPVHTWFKADFAKDLLRQYLDPALIEKQGILHHEVVSQLITDYLDGKSVDFNKVWMLLVFQMWYEKWMD